MDYIFSDFETTSDSELPQVYSWGLTGEGENSVYSYGIGIDSFIQQLLTYKKDNILYFQNGASFDTLFILSALKRNGFTQKEFTENTKLIKKEKYSTYKEESIKRQKKKKKIIDDKNVGKSKEEKEQLNTLLQPYEFEMLVDDGKNILELKLGLPVMKKRYGVDCAKTITIRDFRKLFAGSLAEFGNILNDTLDTWTEFDEEGNGVKGKWSKLGLDSNYDRTWLYKTVKEFEEDTEEFEYLKQDVHILKEFFKYMTNIIPKNKIKMTGSATAFAEWETIFGDRILNVWKEKGLIRFVKPSKSTEEDGFYKVIFTKDKKQKQWSTISAKKQIINKYFPTNWLNEINENGTVESQVIYNWYSGGIAHVNPMYKGIHFKDIKLDMVDKNSSYPDSQYRGLYPYGKVYYGDGGENYPIKFYKLIALNKIYNQNGFPFLAVNTGLRKEYRTEIEVGSVFYVTNVALERVKKYYTKGFKIECIYSFRGMEGKVLFGDFVDKHYEGKSNAKKEGNGFLQMYHKLNLNMNYGVWGKKSDISSSIWNDKEEVWESEREIVKSKHYLPVAIVTAEISRMAIVDAVGYNYKYFVYCDTDSIVFIAMFSHLLNIEYDKYKLGAWDYEMRNAEGFIRRAKQYILVNGEGKVKSGYAGINFSNASHTPDIKEFLLGAIISKQTRPIKLPTGVLITDIDKEIFPIWEYDKSYGDWFDSEETYFENYPKQIELIKNVLYN